MSRYLGYSKRPKNWKKLLQADSSKIITNEKPQSKPADKVPKIRDSSLTYS
jgi:hypothetical protein